MLHKAVPNNFHNFLNGILELWKSTRSGNLLKKFSIAFNSTFLLFTGYQLMPVSHYALEIEDCELRIRIRPSNPFFLIG